MDKYLSCKDYVDFKREILDPLQEFANKAGKELKKTRKAISELPLDFEVSTYILDIETELPDIEEYEIFCETALLEFEKEIRECELNRYRIEEEKIPFWDFKNLFYGRAQDITRHK